MNCVGGARPLATFASVSGSTVYEVSPRSLRPLLDDLASAGVRFGGRRRCVRTLLDTFDLRLVRAGLWCAVVSPAPRQLVITGRTAASAPLGRRPLPVFARDLPEGPMHDLLARRIGPRALLPVATVTSMASVGALARSSGRDATLELHERSQVAGSTERAVTVLAVSDAPRSLHRLIAARATPTSALGCLDAVLSSMVAVPEREVVLQPSMAAADGFRAVLIELFATIDANWQGVVDRTDPEFLHDLRVALRRSRTLLRHAADVFAESPLANARADLHWLAAQTSVARDLDVYVHDWVHYTAGLDAAVVAALTPLRALMEEHLDAAYATMAEVLAGPEAQAVVGGWREWLSADESERGPLGDEQLAPLVARLTAGAHDRLIREGRRITPESPAQQVHDLRKYGKHLRYLLECFRSLMPMPAAREFVRLLKQLQDNLGEHQDADVQAQHLAVLAAELIGRGVEHGTLIAIGRLAERLEARRRAAREGFAQSFVEFDTKDARQALRRVLAPLAGAAVQPVP